MGYHQILEIIEEQWQESIERSGLWVFVKVFDDLICLVYIPVHDGISQFKGIEVFAHSDLLFHNFGSYALVLRQGDEHLVEFGDQSA